MSNIQNTRYHPLQVSLHWLVVILIFATFLLGKYMSGLTNDSAKIPFLGIHMALGFITLVVIVVRFIVRLRLPKPVSATTGNAFLDWVSKAVHDALYLLVFLMALSGMSLSLQSGLLPSVFGTSGASLPADFSSSERACYMASLLLHCLLWSPCMQPRHCTTSSPSGIIFCPGCGTESP